MSQYECKIEFFRLPPDISVFVVFAFNAATIPQFSKSTLTI